MTKTPTQEEIDKAIEIAKELKNPDELPEPELSEIKPKVSEHEPKFRIKDKGIRKKSREPSPLKTQLKATPEQVDAVIRGITNVICKFRDTENVQSDESIGFSGALYTVGEIHGWWTDFRFLPYLFLVATGMDFAITVWNKPSKQMSKKEEKTEPKTELTKDESDKLTAKIMGR